MPLLQTQNNYYAITFITGYIKKAKKKSGLFEKLYLSESGTKIWFTSLKIYIFPQTYLGITLFVQNLTKKC